MKFYSMKTTTILLCSALSLALAKPNGVYHQEYNYKSSSSSYKNNELQHKNDDSGFYSKDGDFEGRIKPKVNAHNEHSEYVNPNLQTHSHTGINFGENGEMNSYGRMNAQNYDQHGQNLLVEGLNGQNGYHGLSGYGGYGSSSHSNYGAQSSYGSMSSSLQSLTARLQAQLEKQLQDAIYENQRSSSYSMQSSQSLQNLEDELRRNLTDNLDQEIRNQYGSQSIKGGYTYSIAGGKVQPTANYRNQDLEDWRRQAESNLISKLHNSYRQSGSSSSSNSNYYQHNNYQQTTPRAYSTLYPNIHSTTYRPYNYQTTTLRPVYSTYSNSYSQHNEQSSQQIRFTPISNPASITSIAHNVQGDLNEKINEILEDVQKNYFTSTSYGLTNFDVVLQRLENELRSNITYLLDEQLRRNYGTQNVRDGYMYSIGPNGQYSTQYNYNQRDYENLRDQVERNLLQKLKSDFESRKTRYQQTYQSSSNSYGSSYGSSNYGSNYGSYGQNRFDTEYTSMRPSASNMGSLITAGQRGIKGGNNDYRYVQGSNQRVYEVSGGVSDANLAQLQRQLQENLSRSLQQAISKSEFSSGYSSGSRSNNQQAFQYSLQQLTDELNRNLTRQLEEAKSGYGNTYSTYSSGVSDSQLANLRSQLQSDLQKQLQQGLTQSWSSSSSYSASASTSNFAPVRGFVSTEDIYGQHVQNMEGEDCQHDDPNAYHSHRQRRHTGYRAHGSTYGQHQRVGQEAEEVGQVVEDDDFASLRTTNQRGRNQYLGLQVEDVGQVEEDFGKLQVSGQTQSNKYVGQQQEDVGQVVEDDDYATLTTAKQHGRNKYLGQQVESHSQSNKYVEQQQEGVGQVVEDADFTTLRTHQRGRNQYLGQQVGSHSQSNKYVEQQEEDVGQVVEDDFGKLQIGNQYQHQQEDVGQVVEDDFGKLQIGSQTQNNKYIAQQQEDMGQVVENDFGKLQIGSQPQTSHNMGQTQVDLGQIVEDDSFEKIPAGKQQSSSQYNQYMLRSTTQKTVDLGKKIEDGLDQLQIGSNRQTNQQTTGQEQVDLGQVIEEDNLNKIQISSQLNNKLQVGQNQETLGQEIEQDNFKQLQQKPADVGQVEEDDFGKIQVGNQQTTNHQNNGLSSQNYSSINQQNKFYNNMQYANFNQQVEDDALRDFSQIKPKPTNNLLLVSNNVPQNSIQSVSTSPTGSSVTLPKVNDLTQQIEESNFEETARTIQSKSTTQLTTTQVPLTSVPNVISQSTIQQTSSAQSMAEAEAEAERLIEAIRASRRRNNLYNRQYSGSRYSSSSGVYNSNYGTNNNFDSLSSVTENINRGDVHSMVSTSTTEQPENERIYESSTTLNLRPQNSYGNYGSINSENYGSRKPYSSSSRTNYGNTMELLPTPSTIENKYRYKPYRPTLYNSQSGNSYNRQLNYGSQHQIYDEIITDTGREIEPLEPQHATIVEPVTPAQSVNSYRPQASVKGGRRVDFDQTPVEVEIESTTPELTTTTEELSWWKRFGKKVKDGAKNLKEKIVG